MNVKDIIRRPIYLNHITSLLNRGMMLILVGQRRVGKNFLLLDLKKWLEENESDAHVLYIDKERKIGEKLMTADDLYQQAVAVLPEGGHNYLLIDEVQNVKDYQVALRHLYAEDRCQIVATGSNAGVFSSELGTRLGGRYIEIPIYSLNYQEFLQFHKLEDSEKSLYSYLTIGGMPGLKNFDIENITLIQDYIQGVFNTILMTDVIGREKIRNIPLITNLTHVLADITGKLVSPSSIAGILISEGEKVNGNIIANYISYLINALIVRPVWRYDLHGKKLFEQKHKYYFSDHGIRNYLTGFQIRKEIEKIIENVMWHHLLTQGFEVTVGQLRKGEVDFVARKLDKVLYFQATYLLSSQQTIDRELGNLKAINDAYPKYVVSMDPISGELEGYPGINHIHLHTFLKTQF